MYHKLSFGIHINLTLASITFQGTQSIILLVNNPVYDEMEGHANGDCGLQWWIQSGFNIVVPTFRVFLLNWEEGVKFESVSGISPV